ncbi:beta barrel domain-containing protein (plasmid) [Niallia taxi]|uniref:beta barrel domain-containing protein n=1 Tax=Niallia taxi TaxID=2499688 RepID=UPI003F60F16A
MKSKDLSYLQEIFFTTSRNGKLEKGKITALGENFLTINSKYVFHVDTMKAKGKYNSGKIYTSEKDYHEEKEYEKNVRFLEVAFLNLKNKLTLEQTRKIIEVMSE